MIKSLLCLLFFAVPVLSQSINQRTFKRDITVLQLDGVATVKARRNSTVVFDDRGRVVETVTQRQGKIVRPSKLKPGEYLVIQEHDLKEFGSRVDIKEFEPEKPVFIRRLTKGAPQLVYSTWAPGAFVRVYVEAGFNSGQHQAIARAIGAWNVGPVKFEYQGEGEGQVTIKRQSGLASDGKQCAYSDLSSANGVLIEGVIFIDPKVAKAAALESVVAHELGHSMGLTDCEKCNSVMRGFPGANRTNGYFGPTQIDLNILRGAMFPR